MDISIKYLVTLCIVVAVLDVSFKLLIIIDSQRHPTTMPAKEKIAYTERLIKNLIPIATLLVTDAENQFGAKTGYIKRSYVIDELYKRVPDEYKKYVIEANLDVIIDQVLPRVEVFWAENPQIMNRK